MIARRRHSVRLRGHDYRSSGSYFVTICVHPQLWRQEVFGRVEKSVFLRNRFGQIADDAWHDLPNHHKTVRLDTFIVMPNHLHCIINLENEVGDNWQEGKFAKPQADSLSVVISSFKASVTRHISQFRNQKTVVWQRSFYEHIVRTEKSLYAIRRYIQENPLSWQDDELNSHRYDGRGHDRSCPYADSRWIPEIPTS